MPHDHESSGLAHQESLRPEWSRPLSQPLAFRVMHTSGPGTLMIIGGRRVFDRGRAGDAAAAPAPSARRDADPVWRAARARPRAQR